MNFLFTNKRGSQYVEAAIVMPAVIMMLGGCLYVILFCYGFLWSRCEVHEELIRISEESDVVYDTETESVSKKQIVRGIEKIQLSKSKEEKVFLLNPATAVRLGDNFDIF